MLVLLVTCSFRTRFRPTAALPIEGNTLFTFRVMTVEQLAMLGAEVVPDEQEMSDARELREDAEYGQKDR